MIDLEKVALGLMWLAVLAFWAWIIYTKTAPEPAPEPVAVQCEVKAVHPASDGGYVITCVIPKGALP